ncbi:MAG: hypothetical protein CVV25_14795, partial [Ignavibacteriae bacterium HGW-Ignavibacteriae-4]
LSSYDDKLAFIRKGLKTTKFIVADKFTWGFFNIEEFETDFGNVFSGFLGKYAPLKFEEKADPKIHSIIDEEIENRMIAKSRFFLIVNSGLIAYHTISNKISSNQFSKFLSQLFIEEYEKMFLNIELQSIKEQYEIFDAIKKFDQIQKVTIYLHPSNPSNRDSWDHIDKMMKDLEAASMKEEVCYKENSKGLQNVSTNSEVVSRIQMTEDGYGETQVRGYLDGELKTISSKENPITCDAPNDEFESKTVFNILKHKFTDIMSRFKK